MAQCSLVSALLTDALYELTPPSSSLLQFATAGHKKCIALLRAAGASESIRNKQGQTAPEVARAYGKSRL